MNDHAALLLIDLQNDFCANGSLAVPEGDCVIAIANRLMPYFKTIIATQDWHPVNHASFESTWPVHCVQNSVGAQLHADLHKEKITKIIYKGTDVAIDSYSAFYDNDHIKSTGLTDWLRQHAISILYVMGLATDYCVKFSVLDAIADGFVVYLIEDGCRGINIEKHDIENAVRQMQDTGAHIILSTHMTGAL